MEALANRYHTMEEFAELYGFAIGDPKTVKAYELALESWREERSRQDYFDQLQREAGEKAYADGFEKGKRDGFAEGKRDGFAEGKKNGFAEGKKNGFAEGRHEGIEQGIEQGIEKGLLELVRDGVVSAAIAAERLGVSEERVAEKVKGLR